MSPKSVNIIRTFSLVAVLISQFVLAEGVKLIEFKGTTYNDDRMFVLSVQQCSLMEDDESWSATVHYDEPELATHWCVLTLRNTPTYPAVKVNVFDTQEDAQAFFDDIERQTPMISYNGNTSPYMTIPEYKKWKSENELKEYDPVEYFKKFPTRSGKIQETITILKRDE